MKQIILLGAGGHAAVIMDCLKAQIEHGAAIKIKGLLDDSGKTEWMGYPILGTTDLADQFNDGQTAFILAIGSNEVRERLAKRYSHLSFYTVIHPSAIIGTDVTIGEGTVVMPRVVMNANAQVGCHAIINTGVIVEHDFNDGQTAFILAIGSNEVRERLAKRYSHLSFYTVIHPSAIIGTDVTIGEGTVVMPRVVMNANAQVGCHAIINTGVIVEHDNRIGDYVHLSPNATLCGTVTVGDLTHIGAGSTVIQGVTIGSRSVIGAGATVISDLGDDVTAVGIPAQVIKQRK